MESFAYSDEFVEAVKKLHEGMEDRPGYSAYISAHLGESGGRLMEYADQLVPEIEYRCGPLEDQRILDFGCGTGATTVALCQRARRVSVFDIDPRSVEINRLRLAEHGLQDRIENAFCAASLDEVKEEMGHFDFILMNGVIEHIPRSRPGLRERIIRDVFGLLEPGGRLFINDTPNRLLPYDHHSTQLWWIPWTRAGSRWAYDRAVACGRHSDVGRYSKGPLGLEEEGAWGTTYWEITRALAGERFKVLNREGRSRDCLHHVIPPSWKRTALETALRPVAGITRAPVTAFFPYLTNLVIERSSERG